MGLRNSIDKALASVLVVLMSVMVINVLWQVASRYLMGAPSIFTDELANFLLIWVGLLGSAYAAGQKAHMAIEILPNKLTGTKKYRLSLLISILSLLFAISIMIIGGFRLVYLTLSLEQLSATLRVPLGYVYLVIPISGILIVFYSIMDIKATEK
jgi:TRAP-type C4-dicarboxylate transport system permease small subunit